MNWLWIPAAVLVTLFILVLCWLFFKDYTCCPCRRRNRSREPVLPTHHTPASLPHDQYSPSAPTQYPVTPGGSPHLQLTHADLSVRDQESVLPTHSDAKPFSISPSLPSTHTPPKQSLTSSLFHSREPQPSHDQELVSPFTSELPSELVLRPKQQSTKRASFKQPSAIESSSTKSVPEQPDFWLSDPTSEVRLSPLYATAQCLTSDVPKSASRFYPKTAKGSLHLHLRYAKNLSLRKVFTIQHGHIPTLDLHKMTVKEATQLAEGFIEHCMDEQPRKFRIITGRGLHSRNGVPRLKPAIIEILDNYDLEYKEIYSGGCLEVVLN